MTTIEAITVSDDTEYPAEYRRQWSRARHSRNVRPKVDGGSSSGAKACTAISNWLLTIAYICEAVVLTFLLLLSLFTTCTFRKSNPNEPDPAQGLPGLVEIFDFHSGLPSFAFFVGAILLSGMLLLFTLFVSRIRRERLLVFLLVVVTALQIVWIAALELTTYHYPDSMSLMDSAAALVDGELQRFAPDYCQRYAEECASRPGSVPPAFSYFSRYPFQTGPMLWFAFAGTIFGANNIIAFQMLNAFAITGLVAALWHLGRLYGLDKHGQAAFAGLILSCVPLMMFAAFVYPNAVGFAITVAGVALTAQAFRIRRAWCSALMMIGGFLVCAIGVTFKSTFIILMLAAFIAIVLVVLRNRRWWQGLLGAVCLYGAHLLTKVPIAAVERITGQDFGKGLPMSSWIMLGVGMPPWGTPGWWTAMALQNYDKTSGDYRSQSELANTFIAERMHYFANHPEDAAQFFTNKLATEWSEPSFMTGYYSGSGNSAHHFSGLAKWMLAGSSGARLISFENVVQSLVYLLALIGIIVTIIEFFRLRHAPATTTADSVGDSTVFARTFLAAAFLGGFLCYVFWEAKGIYTLPFYLLLFPLAAYGVQTTIRAAHRRVTHMRSKKEQD